MSVNSQILSLLRYIPVVIVIINKILNIVVIFLLVRCSKLDNPIYIPDIIERFHHLDREKERKRTEQSFFVPKQEIVDNGYDLSINKYKKTETIIPRK